MSRRSHIVRPTVAAGSYHRNDFLGTSLGDSSALPFADQTLLGIVQAQPSLMYTEWAQQSGDTLWTDQAPTSNYQAFAITDQQLVAASAVATSAPQVLAVISPTLTFATSVTKAFEGTPYAYVRTEGVYAQLDPGQPPRPLFLYWLQLRALTDSKTGTTSLNFAAANVLGILSYILEVPLSGSDRALPSTSFTQALGLSAVTPIQPTIPSAQIPALPASSSPAAPAAPASATASAADKSRAVLLVGLGAFAAYGGYQIFQHYRESRR